MNNPCAMPVVMAILNVTPDSFSDGGKYSSTQAGFVRAEKVISEGAQIIDVGGESTRPGASPVVASEEIARVVPVISLIAEHFDVSISIDTSKADVMLAAVEAGATLINDVRALRAPGALETVAELGVEVCLMHMRGEPRSMQAAPAYDDVVEEVYRFLSERVEACLAAGICKEKIMIDPGFGFGKSLAHNLTLLGELDRFKSMGLPLMVGLSRKSMFGHILHQPVEERMIGSVAAATIAAWLGADVLRVHDVAETVDALKVCHAVRSGEVCG